MKRFISKFSLLAAAVVAATIAVSAAVSAAPLPDPTTCSVWGKKGTTTAGGNCYCGVTRAVAMVGQSTPSPLASPWGANRSGHQVRVTGRCFNDSGRSYTSPVSAWTSSSSGARVVCPASYPYGSYAQCMIRSTP